MVKQLKLGVIVLLAVAGLVLLISEPVSDVNWGVMMFWKSMAGFGCWGVCAMLCKRWVRYE